MFFNKKIFNGRFFVLNRNFIALQVKIVYNARFFQKFSKSRFSIFLCINCQILSFTVIQVFFAALIVHTYMRTINKNSIQIISVARLKI